MIALRDKPFENCQSVSLPGMPLLYYKPERVKVEDVLLDIEPSVRDLIYNYFVSDGKSTYGYYSGLKALNNLHGTTQVPALINVVSSKVDKEYRYNRGKMTYNVEPQRFKVDSNEYRYVQILDTIEFCYNYFEEDIYTCIKYIVDKQALDRKIFNKYLHHYSERTKQVINDVFAL